MGEHEEEVCSNVHTTSCELSSHMQTVFSTIMQGTQGVPDTGLPLAQECLARRLGIENQGPPETEGFSSPAKRAKTFRGLEQATLAARPGAACHGHAAATPARRDPSGHTRHEHLSQQQPEPEKAAPQADAADCGSPRHARVSTLSLSALVLQGQPCLSSSQMLRAVRLLSKIPGTSKGLHMPCELMQEAGTW